MMVLLRPGRYHIESPVSRFNAPELPMQMNSVSVTFPRRNDKTGYSCLRGPPAQTGQPARSVMLQGELSG
jgi:hypothetical protein